MSIIDTLAEALMSATMALTPRFFERNSSLALLGACWAAAPWAFLGDWLWTAPLTLAGIDVSLLLRLAGCVCAMWTLVVFLSAWYHLHSRFRTALA